MAGVACASSSSSSLVSKALSSAHSTFGRRNQAFLVSYPTPSPIFSRVPITLSTVAFARRKKNTPATTSNDNDRKKKKSKSKVVPQNDDAEEEDFDEDSIEALFKLLEEDLKKDLSSGEGDDGLTEEVLAKLEQELEEALGSDEEISGMLDDDDDDNDNDEDEDEDDDDGEEDDEDEDEDEEKPVELKKWQLRRLASALKIGRRKTSIKSLAAELCLDRAVVLELLRDPPPDLLLLSAALPDRVVPTISEPEAKLMEPSADLIEDVLEPEPEVKLPVHVMQSRWSMQKRLKKVQVETLERVYNRSKRPTNAMVSSIVHVTNLPRKRIVKWFEDKRAEDGVPNTRLPFQRSTSDTVLTN